MYALQLLLLFLAIIPIACSTIPDTSKKNIVWPAAPELPRVVYETTLRDGRNIRPSDTESELQTLAVNSVADDIEWLVKPYDIAAKQGLIVVSDTLLSAVHVFDVPRKKLFAIGLRGEGRLVKPLGVALDQALNIYVADAMLQRVVKFDKQGHFLAYIGQAEEFSRIIDVAVSPQDARVYVLDRGGIESSWHRLQIFSAAGERLKVIGERGNAPEQFNHPVQLDVDLEGNIYVLDSGNFRVSVFDAEGRFVRQWGQLGQNLGDFARPRGLAVNRQQLVFVTDAAFQNFQIFDKSGQLLINIGEGGGEDLPGRYALPAGIAVDETNRIYLVDQLRKKIEVLRLLESDEITKLQPSK